MIETKLIVIKNYQEFTEELSLDDGVAETAIIAKEVEAVISLSDDEVFSIGFSVMRDNDLFSLNDPREMVRHFMIKTFTKRLSGSET